MEEDIYSIEKVAGDLVRNFRAMGIRIFRGKLYLASSGSIERDKDSAFFVFNHYRIDLHGLAKDEDIAGITNIVVEFPSLEEAANFMKELEDIVVYDLIIYENEDTIEYQHQFYLVNAGLFVVVYEPKPVAVSVSSEIIDERGSSLSGSKKSLNI